MEAIVEQMRCAEPDGTVYADFRERAQMVTDRGVVVEVNTLPQELTPGEWWVSARPREAFYWRPGYPPPWLQGLEASTDVHDAWRDAITWHFPSDPECLPTMGTLAARLLRLAQHNDDLLAHAERLEDALQPVSPPDAVHRDHLTVTLAYAGKPFGCFLEDDIRIRARVGHSGDSRGPVAVRLFPAWAFPSEEDSEESDGDVATVFGRACCLARRGAVWEAFFGETEEELDAMQGFVAQAAERAKHVFVDHCFADPGPCSR